MTENEIVQAEVVEEKSTDIMEIDVDDIFDIVDTKIIPKEKLQILAEEFMFENRSLDDTLKKAGITRKQYSKYMMSSPKFDTFIKKARKIKMEQIKNEIMMTAREIKDCDNEDVSEYNVYDRAKNRKKYNDLRVKEAYIKALKDTLEVLMAQELQEKQNNSNSKIDKAVIFNITTEDKQELTKMLGGFE